MRKDPAVYKSIGTTQPYYFQLYNMQSFQRRILLCVALVAGSLIPTSSFCSPRYATGSPVRAHAGANNYVPSLLQTRNPSCVLSVQASRAVDMDDSTTINEIEDTVEATEKPKLNLEGTFETSLETALDTAQIDADMRELTQKVLNAVFLAVSFGWAAYTILNIDSGMTRGWTQSEIAMRIPLDNWSNYESSLMEKPIFTKTLINVIIYLLGDWLSQTVFQKKNILDFDVSRTLRNGFIGEFP